MLTVKCLVVRGGGGSGCNNTGTVVEWKPASNSIFMGAGF